MVGGVALGRFDPLPPEAASLPVPVDGHLSNVKGIGRALSTSRSADASKVCTTRFFQWFRRLGQRWSSRATW